MRAARGATRELLFVERDQVVPHLALGEEAHEERERLRVTRREIEHALVRRSGSLRAVQALAEEAPKAQVSRDLLFLGGRLEGEALEARRQLLEAALLAIDVLQEQRRAAVLRVDVERLRETGDDLVEEHLASGHPLLAARGELGPSITKRGLGGAHQERALQRAVLRGLCLVDVPRHELPPLGAASGAPLDRLFRVVLVGHELEHALVHLERGVVVEELVVEDSRELFQQLELAGASGGERDLEAEERGHRVVLAPHLVGPTRRLEELRELLA